MKYDSITSALAGPFVKKRAAEAWDKGQLSDSDTQVINSVREGDTDAFGELVRKYEDFVFTLILGLVHSEDTAKDVAQEVFLRAYRGIRRFELKSSFKTWLYRIAYNTAISHLNREKAKKRIEIDRVTEPVFDTRRRQSLRLTLEKLIGLLKPDHKSVIILHYYDDLKYEEIAEVMDCPIGTVKIRLYRAKHELKKLWAKYAV
jgi:RNA polymerase sigma-70 factor (ECF subfamily)